MNKTITIIIVVVLIGVSFYGGMLYGKSQTPSRGNFAAFAQGTGGRTRGTGAGGGNAIGQIISKSNTSITVSVPNGGSKIILYSPSTTVMKSVLGTSNDFSIGQEITANGTVNSDGSITAQSIQIRPATTTRAN